MHRSILIASLATTALSQLTVSVNAVSQISDGQPQAPTGPAPSVETPFVSSTATVPYSNPLTSYLSMTNSLGVVTGMPSVVTSQPPVFTSQPISSTNASYTGYAYRNSTTSSAASAAFTVSTNTVGSSSSAAVGESASTAASASISPITGSADMNRVAGAGLALVVLGVGFSML